MDALEVRVAKLERTARRWRMLAFVFGVGLAGLGAAKVAEPEIPDMIAAKNFYVVDKDKKVMARIGYEEAENGFNRGYVVLSSNRLDEQGNAKYLSVLSAGEDVVFQSPVTGKK